MKKPPRHFPDLGFGLGLRPRHYPHIFERWPEVDWFEIISENFMDTDGRPRRNLARIREKYPVVMHGVAMSIGTVDPLNSEYLEKLKKLTAWLNPAWISDHLCWTGIAHANTHDLLPVPYTEEALNHIVSRIRQVQDYLERPVALENPSTYLEFKTSRIPEAEFIAQMMAESGCYLLLDVNNVYVSCYNHRLDPKAYIDALPLDRVVQIHLSGHTNKGTHIIDTHDDFVVDEVWALYRYVVHKAGRTPNTMIEWDDNIPEFDVLYKELGKARIAARDAHNHGTLPALAAAQLPHIANPSVPLAQTESRMQEAILLGGGIDARPDEWIRSKPEFAPREQLAVYVNAYRSRLSDVVAEDYPVLRYYLGDWRFKRLIGDFVNTVRSTYFNIGRYAAQLPGFLKCHEAGDGIAFELAALENAISQLTDPEETTPLQPDHLEGMTPARLMKAVLSPRKALELFSFEYPVNRYYCDVKEERSPTQPAKRKTFVAVFRHDDVVWRMDLGKNEYQLLKKLFAGMPVGDSLEALQAEFGLAEEELSADLSLWFARWMRNGLLARISSDKGHYQAINTG